MKNVRVFYTKNGACKYVSHLDTNRIMLRAIGKSRLNIWHTEGFNRHAYITFALPLSLGFSSNCESMDFRVLDDNEDLSAVPEMLNSCLPEGIRIFACKEAVKKPADIKSASYDILLEAQNEGEISVEEIKAKLSEFLAKPEIIVEKKTKKGKKEVDLKSYILDCKPIDGEKVGFSLTLPAGSALNINPTLFIDALSSYIGAELYAQICRTGIFCDGGADFE